MGSKKFRQIDQVTFLCQFIWLIFWKKEKLVTNYSHFTMLLKNLCCFLTLLEKAKLAREISDGKNKIPHKFLDRKI